MLWTNEFNSGNVDRIDPLTRRATLLQNMGLNDCWGMAYDEECDRIYLFEHSPDGIHVLDPTPLSSDGPQVNELSFN